MMEFVTAALTPEIIENAMDYVAYRQLIDELLSEGKTTGPTQTEALLNHTRMNVQRMNRIDKHITLQPETLLALDAVRKPLLWLVITEAWCGDAAQNVPVLAKMADYNPLLRLRFILRDEHPAIMDQFLTNGTRSIPKLIVLNAETLEVIDHWGPRPQLAHQMVIDMKAQGIDHDTFVLEVHKWYGTDKTITLQKEITAKLPSWTAAAEA